MSENSHMTEANDGVVTTWVMTTKSVGDKVAGWVIDSLEEDNVRYLESSERCTVTSFCYPTGAKVVKARLLRGD